MGHLVKATVAVFIVAIAIFGMQYSAFAADQTKNLSGEDKAAKDAAATELLPLVLQQEPKPSAPRARLLLKIVRFHLLAENYQQASFVLKQGFPNTEQRVMVFRALFDEIKATGRPPIMNKLPTILAMSDMLTDENEREKRLKNEMLAFFAFTSWWRDGTITLANLEPVLLSLDVEGERNRYFAQVVHELFSRSAEDRDSFNDAVRLLNKFRDSIHGKEWFTFLMRAVYIHKNFNSQAPFETVLSFVPASSPDSARWRWSSLLLEVVRLYIERGDFVMAKEYADRIELPEIKAVALSHFFAAEE